MDKRKRRSLLLFLISFHLSSNIILSQELLPLSNEISDKLNQLTSEAFHSSIKPYLRSDLDSISDLNIFRKRDLNHKSILSRKLLLENLIELRDSNYQIDINFLPNFTLGKDKSGINWLNSRGFQINGKVLDNIYFYSDFHEVQSDFPQYVESIIQNENIIPGQSFPRKNKDGNYDFYYGSGLVSYSPNRTFNFQFGHGKNFIGDGYRSMLLSDISTNYPYFKLTATLSDVRYMFLLSYLMHKPDWIHYERKYSVAHYFDWNITKNISVGFFESIIWKEQDSSGYRGFDINYLNPVIFLRPVEFSLGSPDNMVLGINISAKPIQNIFIYGQLMLDEFILSEFFNSKGSVNKKFGFQIGLKMSEVLGVDNLSFQSEINAARPYTYSHFDTVKSYSHYSQSLAHPIGANFFESIAIIKYSFQKLLFKTQFNYAFYGMDAGESNFGKNIFRSYMIRENEYGNYIGQGDKTDFYYFDFSMSYLVNPNYNLRVEAGIITKNENSVINASNTMYYYFGLRSSFRNLYYDF